MEIKEKQLLKRKEQNFKFGVGKNNKVNIK